MSALIGRASSQIVAADVESLNLWPPREFIIDHNVLNSTRNDYAMDLQVENETPGLVGVPIPSLGEIVRGLEVGDVVRQHPLTLR